VALASRITLSVESNLTSVLDLLTATAPLVYSSQIDLATGVGQSQADMQWSDTRTLTPSATEDLDLAGVLVGPLGTTLTFARIKGLFVRAAAANTNNVVISRPAANGVPLFSAASDALPVMPGGWFGWVAPNATGVAVTPATGDLITVTNGGAGTSVTYDVIVLGASA
jgi:hypothetical protein